MFQFVVFFLNLDDRCLFVKVEVDLLKCQLVLLLKLSNQIDVSFRFQIQSHLVFSCEVKQFSFNSVKLFLDWRDRVINYLFGCVALQKICESNGVELEGKMAFKLVVSDESFFSSRCLLLEIVVEDLLNH